ncbi:MAG: glucoamylase family protein, partial [Clostridia bacterium]|nr:glucoamylase family protein [Clostridia bacterium]
YNWYDTRTLIPLKPRYVSTVDSGNFVCVLVALREGCREYLAEAPGLAQNIIERIQAIEGATDLSVLFNKRRKLFHIGYDVETEKLSEIYYDLLMSEARMTSYYAIAKRAAPKRHWGALGRTLARQNGYTGPVSWTGSMFEYLMPHLLLPVYEDSMTAEALRFALYCQKRRVRGTDIPWGISESGFYAFDAALNYQYKGHGVQKLALKRGVENELVIAPYATFLALEFDPGPAMRNLERLEEKGMYGRCGFFEAMDFTFRRTEGRPAVIKSYMAHHVGMSIVASANALLDGVMQQRFMRDYEMKAAQELLEEKIPWNAVVFNDVLLREVPDKPGRAPVVREEFEEISPVTPRVQMISNGEYTMLITDTGASVSLFRGIDVTRRSSDLLRNPLGVYAVASFDGVALPLTAAPEYSAERLLRKKVEFNSNGAVFHARTGNFEATMHAILHAQMPCECRMVELENLTARRVEAKLLFYFEPSLAKAADEAAHPAFSRLFLNVTYRPESKLLIFARRPRGGELPAYLACGLAEQDAEFEFETDRTRLLSRPEGIASLSSAVDAVFTGKTGAIPDAAAALRLKATLGAHGKKYFTLLLAAANTPDEAALRLAEARRIGYAGILHNAAGKETNEMESRLAALILPSLLFNSKDNRDAAAVAARNQLGQ